MKNKEELDKLRQSIGVVAEMALIYIRALLEAGATREEVATLSQAYISALMFGNRKDQPEDE